MINFQQPSRDTFPQAIIFDLDGCLVDSEILSLNAIACEMRALGVADVEVSDLRDRFLGVAMRDISAYVETLIGAPCPDDFQTRVESRLFAAYASQLKVIDGVRDLLGIIIERDIKFGIATGGSIERMQQTLKYAALEEQFGARAYSADQVQNGKPAPDLFLFAARQLGVEPQTCVVLEDSPHGILGAKDAGMRAFGFVGGSHLDGVRDAHGKSLMDAGAERVLTQIEDFAEALGLHTDAKSRGVAT